MLQLQKQMFFGASGCSKLSLDHTALSFHAIQITPEGLILMNSWVAIKIVSLEQLNGNARA